MNYSKHVPGVPLHIRRSLFDTVPKQVTRIVVSGVIGLVGTVSVAEEIDFQAMSWAAACVTCHGAAEPVAGSTVASLAGMDADELVGKMEAFATGDTPGSLMQQLARGYDADVLRRIAGWYEQLGKEAP